MTCNVFVVSLLHNAHADVYLPPPLPSACLSLVVVQTYTVLDEIGALRDCYLDLILVHMMTPILHPEQVDKIVSHSQHHDNTMTTRHAALSMCVLGSTSMKNTTVYNTMSLALSLFCYVFIYISITLSLFTI